MDQLVLKPRKPVEDDVENWDDDDLDIGGEDFTFRSASAATTATMVSTRRESVSSRLSIRSDFNEERQVHLPEDDERATNDAIATAKMAGIPLPENVPSSALLGGTIKRLGGRKLRKVISDDWDDGDIQVPLGEALKIKRQDGSKFPETLRQVSGPGSLSPQKTLMAAPVFHTNHRPELKTKTASSNMLDRYRDEDDDFLADGEATIKVSKKRNAVSIMPSVTSPTPEKRTETEEDFEQDLQLPSDGALKLTTRKDIPKTPQSSQDDFDDWGEGSLGTRFGGTKRDGRSNRNSDSFAMSPSIASSMTAESEDEGLEGLVLPSGPLNFDDILKKRQQNDWPERQVEVKQPRRSLGGKDDFLTGLELGDGDVFDSKKLTFNRNIKIKATKQQSPTRPKPSVSLTFTNKPAPPSTSRLPRPLGHERIPSSLEPVSESGGPIPSRNRRSQSRMGHSTHSSINGIGISNATSSNHPIPPSTPRRRELGSKSSASNLRNEPTTTSSQLLKLKRSMPTMKTYQPSPAKPMPTRYERPPSQTESSNRPLSMSRSKDSIERDRSGAESSMSFVRKNPVPFLPAGAPISQSHHVAAKSSRHLRRNDSESSSNSADCRPPSRTFSRQTMRSPSPRRALRGADMLAREATLKRQITKPIRRRHFGDGCELDAFDDLPTSRDVEQKFVKEPIGRGPPRQLTLRNKAHQHIMPTRTASPIPLTPLTPAKSRSELPRFARDTAASRMAREATSSNRSVSGSGAPLAALTNQWRAKVAATTGLSPVHAQGSVRSKKHKVPQKPQLIKPLGNVNNPRSVKGMKYDPVNYRWEGNEIEVSAFDMPVSATSTASIPVQTPRVASSQVYREKECSTPRPALITNINSAQNVQVVGGMVFDPQRMCWLKMPGDSKRTKSDSGDTMDGFDALDEEEDVFKDVPDLEEGPSKESDEISGSKGEGVSGLSDWLVGEEFDVGPEFVKRQREEEERWRRKCEKWTGAARDTEGNSWRWSIRDVVNEL
ncbi:5b98d9d0-4074-4e4e-8a12-57293a833313 [Sclerotinia trifoliorum]|uniref:5b98d9d0-4074-4e4e-8a12-57293a833313 n=1 Tax=Sclerotinia trifoliorum TaxID=28548 RepID=A0A8H2VS69_9HELO|nr:5b98d9d0-4074-4e4e-8a12-57293a833313 [Sclerotinia trifoliorum]